MATKKVNGSIEVNVTKKTKDTTYVIDKNATKTAQINIVPPGICFKHRCKGTDDLCVAVLSGGNGFTEPYSIALLTIKDYYKYASENNNLVQVNKSSIYESVKDDEGSLIHGKFEGAVVNIAGDKKATTYNVTNLANESGSQIRDFGGNDKYTVGVSFVYADKNDLDIEDYGGNDKYTVIEGSMVAIDDFAGKDNYTSKGSMLKVSDNSGNDKYTAVNSKISIFEIKGNDNYNISQENDTTKYESGILDYLGNDKYVIKNVDGINVSDGYTDSQAPEIEMVGKSANKDTYTISETSDITVNDFRGNDKYTISDTAQLKLDDSQGNDTYILTNVQTMTEEGETDPLNYHIDDAKGNDKYTISGERTNLYMVDVTGEDTYNVKGSYNKKTKTTTYVGSVDINDYGIGKNTFNLNYAGYTSITTESGTNVYNIKNSDYVDIESNAEDEATGSDKYTLTSNNYFDIEDYGTTADSYNMTKSWTGIIDDHAGNDTYTINSLQLKPYDSPEDAYRFAGITIMDNAGDKDSLVLKGTKANNIVFMSDFYYDNADEKYESSANSLILYDKSTGGYTYIMDFYKADSTSRDFDGFGKGLIETIKASKKKLDVSTNTEYYTKLNGVKADVVNWLTTQTAEGFDGNFSFVEDVLKFGTDAQKATLVSYFDGTHA